MKFVPYEFMRMIAKVGYSYAVALMGYGSFKPIITNAILDLESNISYFVGMNEKCEPMVPGPLHDIKIVTQVAPARKTLIAANVRLFCGSGTPTYHAIVGEFENLAQEYVALHKLRERKGIEFATTRA